MQQYYFMGTGAITDSLAYRVSGADIERDGDQEGIGSSIDANTLMMTCLSK